MSKILIISDKNKLPIPENLKNVKNTYEQVEDFMRNSVKKKTIKGIYKTNQFHDFVMLKNQFLFELTNTELIQLLCAKNIKLQFVIKKKKRIGKKYEMYNGNCEVQKIISIIKTYIFKDNKLIITDRYYEGDKFHINETVIKNICEHIEHNFKLTDINNLYVPYNKLNNLERKEHDEKNKCNYVVVKFPEEIIDKLKI